jgi:energy-coupling factor transport system ATP-binding protein
MEPRVLLLDEPTAMLDPDTAATVRAVVDEIASRRGLTVVVVEHRLDGWLDQVDRLVVLDAAGRIVADGDPRAVLDEHRDALAAQGIWVPGVPDPDPLELHLPVVPEVSAGVVAPGKVAVAARDVTVEHRSRRLGAEPRFTVAVRDQDLDVAAGRTVALVGPSGAGKSTLMAAAGGLIAPTSGTVDFAPELTDPDDRTRPPAKWASKHLARSVSWVPQRAATAIVGHTVREDVMTTARAIGLDEAAAGSRADTLLEALGLGNLAHADPLTLSGGEQRRLAVASAIAHGPALVLADEPTVGQDRLTWSAVMGVLATAEREGSAVLVTTHDRGVVARAARTIELHAPAAPSLATPAAVRGNPGAPATWDYLEPVEHSAKETTQGLADPREAGERHTLISRAGPLGLLIAALSVIVLPALLQNWRQGLAVLAVEVALGAVALLAPGHGRRPTGRVRGVLLRLAPAMLAVLGVGWSSWLLGGRDVEVATGAALRVLCLVVPSAFVVAYLDPERLGDHLAQRVRLPARAVVAASAALQRVQSFDVLWTELMTTRRVRGIRADHGLVAKVREAGAVTVGLLVGALGQAAVLALAMDSRGFAGAHRRTWAGTAPWRVADSIAVGVGLTIIGAAVAARVLWPG